MSAALPWHPRHLLLAPHRLGFFLAMVLLWVAGLWWALVQLDRLTGTLGLAYVLSPSLVHGAVMTFGFIPLFFSGFLFTAGPKWLGVAPPEAPQLLGPLLLQAVGWLLWLAGAHVHKLLGLGGLALAFGGLLWMSVLFWRLLARSPVVDTLHARVIAGACGVGCASVLGLAVSLWM
ncbi:MAG: NnrS family protein, partial [Rhodoferax sp.]